MTDRSGYGPAIWDVYTKARRVLITLYALGGVIALLVLRLR